MPSCPRSEVIREGEVGVYHVWSRCVRGAFLCGVDPYTGQGYHFSSFINDWPRDQDRPKFVYRYPHGTVVRTDQLIGSF